MKFHYLQTLQYLLTVLEIPGIFWNINWYQIHHTPFSLKLRMPSNTYSWEWMRNKQDCVVTLKFILLLVFCLNRWQCATYVLGALRGQKRVSDTLELEIETVVGCHIVAGNQTYRSSGRTSALDHWDMPPTLCWPLLKHINLCPFILLSQRK